FEEICTTLSAALEPVEIINNSDWPVGMFSSLSIGLQQLNQKSCKSDGILVLLGDMPFITPETLSRFVNSVEPESSQPLIATENNRPAHPYLIRPSHIGEILSLSGESGIRPFIKKHFPEAHKIQVDHTAGRQDIDTWESYFANRPKSSGPVIPPPPCF
ncbi:MAG: NTP transferase domain-containing protein, partial [Deltaproteobacteria bacterium]|nr:NTP transferase domain-containing protein [Candidatus Tharpella sp.]